MDQVHKRFSSIQNTALKGSIITLHREKMEVKRIRTPNNQCRNKKSRSMDSKSGKGTIEKMHLVNQDLLKDLEDPGNVQVKGEIKKIMYLQRDVEGLKNDYEQIRRCRSADEKLLASSKIKDHEFERNLRFTYSYTSYLRGLSTLIDDFLLKLPKPLGRTMTYLNTNQTNQLTRQTHTNVNTYSTYQKRTNSHNISNYNITSTSKKSTSGIQNSALENLYSNLGHEVYTKLINIFEKYCFYGKTYTNFNMDYSQFQTFMVQNKIYDKLITKTQTELIFNKIRNNNKSICFEEFIIVLMEISKLVFNWEKNFLKSFSYFVNKYIIHIPCLKKTDEEKNMERWYFFLEYPEFINEIRKHLPHLHKVFHKNKVKDLKVSECINTTNFLKMCKDMSIIPVFLSTKEIINITNFVKYRKKSLLPNNNFDFCSFIEIICIIALQAFDKYIHEETKHKYLEHVEKLKIFLKYINEKV